MEAGEKLTRAIEALGRELDRSELEPDPQRDDWAENAERVSALRRQAEEGVREFERGVAALDDVGAAELAQLRNNTAHLVAEVAAVLQAASRRDEAARLLRDALDLGPTGESREEIEAAERDPSGYVLLVLGRWHLRSGDFTSGDRALSRARGATKERALRRTIERTLEGPRPLTSGAPPLFRINGCGLALYGSRDPWDDGSHVSTYCACLLFIPVFPLTAYRVIDHGRSYTFIAKERLSAFARGYRLFVAAAAAIALLAAIGSAYLGSPTRLASVALDDAAEHEQAGELDRALEGYQRVLTDHPGASDDTAHAAALGVIRILAARVEEPMTPERVGEAARNVRRYQDVPARARGGEAATLLASRLQAWAEQVDDPAAQLRLIDLATQVATGADRDRLLARGASLHTELARSLKDEWPLEALHHYVLAGTAEALREATALIASLDASLLGDADSDVRAWSDAVHDAPDAAAHVSELRSELASREADAGRTRALQTGDADALSILHDESPDDQDVTAALADARRATGDVDGAIALLAAYGPPGRLDAHAQRSLAGCYADHDELERADALLTRQVELRLPAFQEAQRAYDEASRQRSETLMASARAGLEHDLEMRLNGVTDQAQGEQIVMEWLRARLESDPELTRLRDAWMRENTIVPTVLTLGTLKLRRAHEAHGEARDALLGESERLFLAIREEAAGVPAFHTNLGQVYHRLGRTEDGERELQQVLDEHDPESSLGVAQAYRELGLVSRAREVAQAVYEETEGRDDATVARGSAAMLMALLATRLEDEETWLARAPQDNPDVRTELVSVRARRAAEDGDLREADRLFADVVRHFEEQSETNAAAANNAAVAYQARYTCTGEAQHLESAVSLLERSLRMRPDNAVVLGNLADVTAWRGDIRVLDRFVRAHVLRMDPSSTRAVLELLREGPLADDLAAAVRDDVSLRRGRELTSQEQVLAPQRPQAWVRAWVWAADDDDDAALAALLSRVRATPALDTTDDAEERERASDPDVVARRQVQLDAAVTDAERVLDSAERTRHAPTVAVARVLLSGALSSRALERSEVEDARRALSLARQAREGWDAITDAQVTGSLTTLALLESLDDAPALRAIYDELHRDLPPVLLMREAIRREPSLATVLRARPELAEATQLRSVAPPRSLGLDDLALAEVAHHEGLRAAAEPCRTRPSVRSSLELRALLRPTDPVVPARRALLGT